MKSLLFICICMIGWAVPAMAQLQFVQRYEVETKFSDDDFLTVPIRQGLFGFRTHDEKGFSGKRNLQYFITDFQLSPSEIQEFRLKDYYDISGFDMDDEKFYGLFQKGVALTSEKYIFEVDVTTGNGLEYAVENILAMELVDFLVMDGHAIFMGIMDYRPVIQLYDLDTKNIFTVEGIYAKDAKILQLRKDPSLGVIDVVTTRRDIYKNKILTILTFDMEGNKVREVKMDGMEDPEMEVIEGILTPIIDYKQAMIGPFGLKRREAYYGLIFTKINEFGEYNHTYHTLREMENFYNYLNEKALRKKKRSLEKDWDRGRDSQIRNVLATREVINLDGMRLVYSDQYSPSSMRYVPRDGMYANSFYRHYPYNNFNNRWNYGNLNSMYYPGYQPHQSMSEYKYISAHFMLLDTEGKIIWDNAVSLDNAVINSPAKFGEVSFDGNTLFYLYLENLTLKLSIIKNGRLILENEPFQFELVNEEERIKENQDQSMSLMWWYDNYYLLSGKQRIRYLTESGKEGNKEVFFLTKIRVDDIIPVETVGR
ncbi:transcriptional regulator [Pararhodonellum marinum]|uniref:transcriptional regulator n=1 Tax=Pararhodonellum marinum TaxID=2755358 RepID=UPI001E5D8345|nr:transcriptional regulator [Pararhodonellum marinum]